MLSACKQPLVQKKSLKLFSPYRLVKEKRIIMWPFAYFHLHQINICCLSRALEMTGACSLALDSHYTNKCRPERANAVLMNNKSTVMTECQPLLLIQLQHIPEAASLYFGFIFTQFSLKCVRQQPRIT